MKTIAYLQPLLVKTELSPPKHTMTSQLIYKVMTPDQWDVLDQKAETVGAPIDIQDGFVHFSTAGQCAKTLELYFAQQPRLRLVAVDAATLGDALKWETSRGGDAFPHLYAKLQKEDVLWVETLALDDNGVHVLPDKMK
jgi:uncharacterized protein (DUF952 family)